MTYDPTNPSSLAAAFDEFPYESMPFSFSHPATLAGAAKLFGLNPPDLRGARVLELACAAGGNIIPHAAYYPDATFVGIDISGVQISEGQTRIAEIGLKNIELRQGSLTDITPADGQFDYIISHGLYSWIPPAVREAVLRVSSENLTPNGVTYISYNIYPGWHMKMIVRDLMLFHTMGMPNPRERVTAGRAILADVKKYSSGAYHAVIAQELDNLDAVGDYYIRHEQLGEENTPFTFNEFAADAAAHGLTYLAEADLATTFLEAYAPPMARAIRTFSKNDFMKSQQYLDYSLGRTFRMSILVKDEQAAAVDRRVTHEGIQRIAFAVKGPLTKEGPLLRADGSSTFANTFASYKTSADAILVQTPAAERAMDFMGSPLSTPNGTLTLQSLCEYVYAGATPSDEQMHEMSSLVIELFRRRMIQVWGVPFHWSPISEKPKAFRILASDAQNGHEYSTLINHEPISFAFPATRVLLSLIDGTRDHATLRAELAERVRAGTLVLESLSHDFSGITDIDEACALYLDMTLKNFARLKMLEA